MFMPTQGIDGHGLSAFGVFAYLPILRLPSAFVTIQHINQIVVSSAMLLPLG